MGLNGKHPFCYLLNETEKCELNLSLIKVGDFIAFQIDKATGDAQRMNH